MTMLVLINYKDGIILAADKRAVWKNGSEVSHVVSDEVDKIYTWKGGYIAGSFPPKESTIFYIPSSERVFKFGRDPIGKGACAFDKKIGNQIETIVSEKTVKSYRLTLDESGFPSIQRDN